MLIVLPLKGPGQLGREAPHPSSIVPVIAIAVQRRQDGTSTVRGRGGQPGSTIPIKVRLEEHAKALIKIQALH